MSASALRGTGQTGKSIFLTGSSRMKNVSPFSAFLFLFLFFSLSHSARNARRHSAGRTQTPRQATPSVSRRASAEQQLADREELESDPDLEAEDLPHSSSRRPRGRPRKRRIGHSSFPPQQGQTTALGRRSISPIPVPSPPPSHPYPGHRYVYTCKFYPPFPD